MAARREAFDVKPLPSREFLCAMFVYDPLTGVLRYQDDCDGWSPQMRGRLAGKAAGCSSGGYISVEINGISYSAHRIIWKILHNQEPRSIDHQDGDGTNNKELNLRVCTRSQNGGNRKRNAGRCLPKGVHLVKSGKYRALIQVDSKPYNLGLFTSPEAAACAYAAAAARLFGEFARIA